MRRRRGRIKYDLRFMYLFSTVVSMVLGLVGAVKFPQPINGVGIAMVLLVHLTLFYMVQKRTVPKLLWKLFGVTD